MGYKSEQFVRTVDENLFCSICYGVFKDPVTCKDGHSFCRECIEKWLKTSTRCPMDNGVISVKNLVRNYIVIGVIENLEVYCQEEEAKNYNPSVKIVELSSVTERCSWTGKLRELEKHQECCMYQLVKCTHPNCTEMTLRKDFDKHLEECQFKIIVCDGCRETLIKKDVRVHLENYCPKTPVPCPKACTTQDGKITEIMRMDIDDHLATSCGKALVDCPFKDQGCLVQGERQNIEKHVQEDMAAHILLLAKENKQLKDELNQVKDALRKSSGNYIWKIDHFKSIARSESPVFLECGQRWKLFLYTGREGRLGYIKENLITFYLVWLGDMDGSKNQDVNIPVFVRLTVLSVNPKEADYTFAQSHSFTKLNDNLGFHSFMYESVADLPAYNEDGSIKVQCSIQLCYSD